MGKLTKNSIQHIQQLASEKGILEMIEAYLSENGLGHLKVENLELSEREELEQKHTFKHIKGCVEICTPTGCRWKC